MADRKTHQAALLNLQSRTARLSYVLEHFTSIRQKKPDGKTGRPWPGLQLLEDKDKEFIASRLTARDWSGKKAAASMFQMAEQTTRLLKMVDVDYDQYFQLGRVLLSAFCYAGIYNIERLDEAGDSPYYIVGADKSLPEESDPDRTRVEPFPPWTSNTDDFGNRLVKPSHPCAPEFEHHPTIDKGLIWVRAVHKLENTPFRINKEMLDWIIEIDKKKSTRVIHWEPLTYKKDAEKLEKRYKDQKLSAIEKRQAKDKKLRAKDRKANNDINKENKKIKARNRYRRKRGREESPLLEYQRSKGLHTTREEDALLHAWKTDCKLLEKNRWRVINRRQRFDREVKWAKKLAAEDKPFYQRVSVDYRGRVYLPDFSYQGSDFCRGVIEFAESRKMTKQGRLELIRHTVNELGEKLPHDVKYFFGVVQDGSGKSTTEEWADIGSNPLASKSIKEIKRADHPFRFLRCCIEWREELTQGSARKSALPIAADHRNSAFAHQGMLLDNDAGKALVERCSNEDLYDSVAERHSDYPRKLIKAVMVPWSYGGGKDSCVKKLKAYRIEHPGEIQALDFKTVPEIEELVDDIFELLETEFPACIEFRDAVDRAMTRAQARTDRNPTDGVEWSTLSKFDVHQKVFRAKRFKGWVAKGFEKNVEIRCKLPTGTVDWEGMKRKAAPNLVHSQDATVVHMLLSGAVEIEGINDHVPDGAVVYDPLVTVHDSFSVLPTDAKKALNGLAALTNFIYLNDPMVRWGESVIGQGFDTRERTLPELFGDGEPPYT